MDNDLILIAKDGYTADQLLEYINRLAAAWWQSQGYTVENGELIGKKNGEDNPGAAHTITWAEVKTAPDGTQYFLSLSNDPRFCDWKQYWVAAGFPEAYEEAESPAQWLEEEPEAISQ